MNKRNYVNNLYTLFEDVLKLRSTDYRILWNNKKIDVYLRDYLNGDKTLIVSLQALELFANFPIEYYYCGEKHELFKAA